MWVDQTVNERHLGHAATFCSAANGPVLPLSFRLVGIAVTRRAAAPAIGELRQG